MKKILLLISLLGIALSTAHAQLVITEVMSNSSHAGGSGNGDWFEIYNSGVSAVDLTDWSWDDDSATAGTHLFGNISIAAGGFLLVVDENDTLLSNWANDVWGIAPSVSLIVIGNGVSGFSGFGASGDSIFIYDNLNTQQATVTFGASTSGFSFEWSTNGDALDLSLIGENGAFVALLDGNDGAADDNPALYGPGSDVASPGTAVPEPTAGLLSAVGLSFLLLRTRFRKIA